MNFDLTLLRQISILSVFFGVILGFVTLIPFIGTFSLTFLICFIAPLVIWILIKYGCMSLNSIKDSIITGALAGFISYLGFSLIFIPVTVLLYKFFGISSNQGIAVTLNNASFFILAVLSVFMGVLSATVNAFTGFLTFYVLDFMRKQ